MPERAGETAGQEVRAQDQGRAAERDRRRHRAPHRQVRRPRYHRLAHRPGPPASREARSTSIFPTAKRCWRPRSTPGASSRRPGWREPDDADVPSRLLEMGEAHSSWADLREQHLRPSVLPADRLQSRDRPHPVHHREAARGLPAHSSRSSNEGKQRGEHRRGRRIRRCRLDVAAARLGGGYRAAHGGRGVRHGRGLQADPCPFAEHLRSGLRRGRRTGSTPIGLEDDVPTGPRDASSSTHPSPATPTR